MSEKLPALPRSLREGTKFNPRNLPPRATSHNWICIPYWVAGTFHRETQTYMSKKGPIQVMSRTLNNRQFGHQVDSRRRVWHFYVLPEISTVERNHFIEWQITTGAQTVAINQNEVIRRLRAITIDVDKQNQKIRRVEMTEQLLYIRPSGPGKIFIDACVNLFDQHGKKKKSQHSQAEEFLIRPFVPVDYDPGTGIDLRQDFKNYLTTHDIYAHDIQ